MNENDKEPGPVVARVLWPTATLIAAGSSPTAARSIQSIPTGSVGAGAGKFHADLAAIQWR